MKTMSKPINHIRKLRKEADISLTAMAYFTGIPLERMDEIDRMVATPTDSERERIGEVLRVDLFSEEYLGDKVYMKVSNDVFSLLVACANTPRELAEICGVTYETVMCGCARGKKQKYPSYVAVKLED